MLQTVGANERLARVSTLSPCSSSLTSPPEYKLDVYFIFNTSTSFPTSITCVHVDLFSVLRAVILFLGTQGPIIRVLDARKGGSC